jgi:hypothetical protein
MSQPDPMHDQMVQAERSLFGTRLPRPTGVGRHLVVVIVVSAIALGIAIYFAESGAPPPPASSPAGQAPGPPVNPAVG